MKDRVLVSPAPHMHDVTNIRNVMWNVVLALVPALIASVYFWGFRALFLSILGAFSAVCTEALIQKLRKVPIRVSDGSAFLTGLLLAFNINVGAPWWMPVIGAAFAIAIGKQVFGGLGNNPVNPALLGRAFLLASWPTLMTGGWTATRFGYINGISNLSLISNELQSIAPKAHALVTSATPLNIAHTLRDSSFVNSLTDSTAVNVDIVNKIFISLTDGSTLQNLFWGNVAGCIGEVSVFALLIGAAWLLWKNIIEWRIPLFYLGTVAILSFLFGGIPGSGTTFALPIFHLFSGGLILGAFFMATDYSTTPLTKKGRIVFGIGCGVLTVVIRMVGGYPEGVSYSILLMNVFTPLIDMLTMPKAFGKVKK